MVLPGESGSRVFPSLNAGAPLSCYGSCPLQHWKTLSLLDRERRPLLQMRGESSSSSVLLQHARAGRTHRAPRATCIPLLLPPPPTLREFLSGRVRGGRHVRPKASEPPLLEAFIQCTHISCHLSQCRPCGRQHTVFGRKRKWTCTRDRGLGEAGGRGEGHILGNDRGGLEHRHH